MDKLLWAHSPVSRNEKVCLHTCIMFDLLKTRYAVNSQCNQTENSVCHSLRGAVVNVHMKGQCGNFDKIRTSRNKLWRQKATHTYTHVHTVHKLFNLIYYEIVPCSRRHVDPWIMAGVRGHAFLDVDQPNNAAQAFAVDRRQRAVGP